MTVWSTRRLDMRVPVEGREKITQKWFGVGINGRHGVRQLTGRRPPLQGQRSGVLWVTIRAGHSLRDKEAVLRALTTKFPGLPFQDVEDPDVARFCKANQDRSCHLRCRKGRAEGGRLRADGDNRQMGEGVAPAGLRGGNRAADVWLFPEFEEVMRVDEYPGLLPMVVPGFSSPLPPNPLANLAPHGVSLTKVQRLQENFEKLTELLTNLMAMWR